MTFTDDQKAALSKKLDPTHIAQRRQGGQSLDYVEGWYCEHTANEIFGFDGWSTEVLDLRENCEPTQNNNGNFIVSFRATVRVTAGGVIRDGVGFGSGIAKSIHDAYEGAIKEAQTDAEKRALKTFGNRFGLALYDKSRANVGVDVDWAGERDDLTRMVNECKSFDDLLELWKTPRMQAFVTQAPEEFSSPVIKIKDKRKTDLTPQMEAAE